MNVFGDRLLRVFGAHEPGVGVINILYGQIEFILMPFRSPTIFRPSIGEHPIQGNLVFRKER